LWRWNGADTSQFDSPIVVADPTGNPGTLAGVLSTDTGVVSPQAGGTRLVVEVNGTNTSGSNWVVFPITATLPNSYIVEINSDFYSTTVDVNNGWGFLTQGHGAPVDHGYLWHAGGRRARIDAGDAEIGNTQSLIASNGSGQMTLRVEGRAGPFSDYAHFQHQVTYVTGGTPTYDTQRNAFDADDGSWNMTTAGLPPASWNGENGDRFGLAIFPIGVGAQEWYINSMRIWSL
jgi:hypothetical protein